MTSYIACYSIHLSLADGDRNGDIIDPLTTEKFSARDDEEALIIAKSKRLLLDVIENSCPKSSADIKREVILTSIRNQSNKRLVYCIGRTE